MKMLHLSVIGAVLLGTASHSAFGQFEGYINKGLVGVGRVSGDSLDATGLDLLGGIGSSLVFDAATWTVSGDALHGYTYGGVLYALPDRGYGSGLYDYHPRLQQLLLSITPYYGSNPTNQSQIAFTNFATIMFTYGGTNFTGLDPNDGLGAAFPQTTTNSVAQGRRSIDPEGLAVASDGSFFITEEYGPFVYRFSSSGELQDTFTLPAAYYPRRGTYPGTNMFTGVGNPVSGRIRNRGFEGATLTPDGKRLLAILQDPLAQDGGLSKASQNNRLLVFDAERGSPRYGTAVAEYVYRMSLFGSATTNNVQTGASELLALNGEEFLVIERDSNGVGADTNTPLSYKRVVLASLRGATNIINTGYDLEFRAPNQVFMPTNAVPAGIGPLLRQDLVDLIDTNQLAKFGLNISTNWDANTMSEKWESLTLVPLNDPAATNDHLLLIGNDNDFLAHVVYLNGQTAATNSVFSDNVMMAFRVTLPTYGAPTPSNQWPGLAFTGPTNATLSAPARVSLAVTAYDQDGIVTNVVFYEGATRLGEDATFPFTLTLNNVTAGTHTYTAVCADNEGATGTATKVVEVTANNLLPNITLSGLTNATLSAPAVVALSAAASDPDGYVTKVEFFDDATKLGEKTSAPYLLTVSNVSAGQHTYTAVAVDNQGATTTSAAFTLLVTVDNLLPNVTLATPTNGQTFTQPVNIVFTSKNVSDPDGSIAKVEYYRGATKLGQSTAGPAYSLTASNFPAGTWMVHATAYDNQGASSNSLDATITVNDLLPPIIHCPTNIQINCASTNGTLVNFTVTATDNNDGTNVTITCVPPSGSLFPNGTNTVVCTAQDSSTNASSCSFKVIVLPSLVSIERAVIIRWNCGETLQGADNVDGPWNDIPEATSPWVVPSGEARRFYRVRGN